LSAVNAPPSDRRKEPFREIERQKHVDDAITHETFNELSTNFITPFDREDIHDMVSSLDAVVDYIHGATKRIESYKLTSIPPSMCKLADLNRKCPDQQTRAASNARENPRPRPQ